MSCFWCHGREIKFSIGRTPHWPNETTTKNPTTTTTTSLSHFILVFPFFLGRPLTGVYAWVCVCVRSDSWAVDLWPSGAKLDWVSNCQPCVASWAELPWQFSTGHRQHARAQPTPSAGISSSVASSLPQTKAKALAIFICILANSTLNSFMHFALVKSDWRSPLSPHCCCCFSERVLRVCAYKIWMQCAASVGGHYQRDVRTHYAFYIYISQQPSRARRVRVGKLSSLSAESRSTVFFTVFP